MKKTMPCLEAYERRIEWPKRSIGKNEAWTQEMLNRLAHEVNDLRTDVEDLLASCPGVVRCDYSRRIVEYNRTLPVRANGRSMRVWFGAIEDFYWDEDFVPDDEALFHRTIATLFFERCLGMCGYDPVAVKKDDAQALMRVAQELGYDPAIPVAQNQKFRKHLSGHYFR